MIDFTNKCIVTENNVESEQLLKKAIAQHLLLYCETKRKGREDVFSENHKPQPQ